MLIKDLLYSLDDVVIVPAIQTAIKSRYKECIPYCYDLSGAYGYYPLITAPMDFITLDKVSEFAKAGITPIIPRIIPLEQRINYAKWHFCAFGLDEVKVFLDSKYALENKLHIVLDMANGHMKDQISIGSELRKKFEDNLYLIGGNIANPKTYFYYAETNFDAVRCSIGTGSACLTTRHTGVGYGMASLIDEIAQIKRENNYSCKIIADGGMEDYSDIIKSLALGADYVMCGKLFAQAATEFEEIGTLFGFRGMSTKSAQKDMGAKELKTSEGKEFSLRKEYTLKQWISNFNSYLRSAMSYCDAFTLEDFHRKAVCQIVSNNTSKKINSK